MSSFTDFQTAIYKMIEAIPGEDINRPGLSDTPERVAKFFLHEMVHGYSQNPNQVIKNSIYNSDETGVVTIEEIPFYSICEHHFIPFFGHVDISYKPKDGRILDISKFGRIVDIYSKRLQTQEAMTNQIASSIQNGILKPSGVLVEVKAEHLCMSMRGSRKQGTRITTRASLGLL